MSVEKKPVAKVKANFRTKAAEEAAGATAALEAAPGKAVAGKETIQTAAAAQKTAAEKSVQKEVNKMAVKKTETTQTTTAEVKTAAAKKTATAKKTTAAKKTTTAKKTTVKQPEVEVTLQWNGNEYTAARLLQSAKDVWQYDLGKNTDDFKTAQIYVKPEEGKAYVVVNGTESLSFDI